ncbi:MAG: hypothetical protein GY845_11095 [Planctomycetes bacterium]|nr:hypothetical protein [Planctomycetota bacterium]
MDEQEIDDLVDMLQDVQRQYPYDIYINYDSSGVGVGGTTYPSANFPRGFATLLIEADKNRNFVEDYIDAFYPDIDYEWQNNQFFWNY